MEEKLLSLARKHISVCQQGDTLAAEVHELEDAMLKLVSDAGVTEPVIVSVGDYALLVASPVVAGARGTVRRTTPPLFAGKPKYVPID